MNRHEYEAHEALAEQARHNPCQSRATPKSKARKAPVTLATFLRWIVLGVAVLIVVPLFL